MARLRRVGLGVVGAAFALAVPGYVAWTRWDMRRLQSFCAEVRPGTAVKDIRQIAQRHRVDWRWLDRGGSGTSDALGQTWGLMIPAPSTMGDMACSIKHNGSVVISAEVIGP